MRNRGTVRSLTESHRAKATRPDRRNFLPQTQRLPSAAHFSGRLPPITKHRPQSATDHPQFPDAYPHFPADAYEHILTIQNAADLEFPATDPANAPQRAEFRLGIFPPDHHVPLAVPTPTPATPKP
jgi:hypothetical protein